ncbi:MAG: transcriptional regulator [Candidatus Bathyarchaeia archaeon]
MARRGTTEQDVLNMIMNAGEDGVLQSELWKTITADSREGSRAILRLERRRLIERRRELFDGRWTYRVLAKRRTPKIDSIMAVPCAFCHLEGRCSESGVVSPIKCDRLTAWLSSLAQTDPP